MMLREDCRKGYEVIFCGDMNSYEDKTLDYSGNNSGQSPSALINLFLKFELTDIFRLVNPTEEFFTFKSTSMQSRLDQFWISPNLIKYVKKTSIGEFVDIISDHAPITLVIEWKNKKQPSSKFSKTIWNNKQEEKIQQWSENASKFCNKLFEKDFKHSNTLFKKNMIS